jgi:hypothetical protein
MMDISIQMSISSQNVFPGRGTTLVDAVFKIPLNSISSMFIGIGIVQDP